MSSSNSVTKILTQLEDSLAKLFAKAPHLPANIRDVLVKIAPWLALIFGILGLVALLSAGALLSLFTFGFGLQGGILVMLLLSIVSCVLDILAFKPLRAGKKKGWSFLFYASLISLVDRLINGTFYDGIVLNLIGAVIGFWLLFEIRSAYKH